MVCERECQKMVSDEWNIMAGGGEVGTKRSRPGLSFVLGGLRPRRPAETRRIIDHCGAATGLTSSSPLRPCSMAGCPTVSRNTSPWTNLDLSKPAWSLLATHPVPSLSLLHLDAEFCISFFLPIFSSPLFLGIALWDRGITPRTPLVERTLDRFLSVTGPPGRRDGVVRGTPSAPWKKTLLEPAQSP